MTSRDLLYLILDYKANWDLPDFVNSPPAKARLEQINCLLDAFGLTKAKANLDPERNIGKGIIKTNEAYYAQRVERLAKLSDLEYVFSGQFLNDRPKSMYQELMDESIVKVKHIYPEEGRAFYELRFSLWPMFKELYSFRLKVFKACDRTSGVLEGFMTGVAYAEALRSDVIDVLEESIGPVDRVLCMILDPEGMDLDKEAIGFPDYDLGEIDDAWMVDRY
jgi:hypothetical protein